MDAIKQAVERLGGAKGAAAALGVSHQLVYFWLQGKRTVPAEKCPDIERLTRGEIRCEQLRPDVAWDVLREQSAHLRGSSM
jgi:DNA-binding transcriptional regulator YdaS (Cro superfamily)